MCWEESIYSQWRYSLADYSRFRLRCECRRVAYYVPECWGFLGPVRAVPWNQGIPPAARYSKATNVLQVPQQTGRREGFRTRNSDLDYLQGPHEIALKVPGVQRGWRDQKRVRAAQPVPQFGDFECATARRGAGWGRAWRETGELTQHRPSDN